MKLKDPHVCDQCRKQAATVQVDFQQIAGGHWLGRVLLCHMCASHFAWADCHGVELLELDE